MVPSFGRRDAHGRWGFAASAGTVAAWRALRVTVTWPTGKAKDIHHDGGFLHKRGSALGDHPISPVPKRWRFGTVPQRAAADNEPVSTRSTLGIATRPVCSTLRQCAYPLGGGGRFHRRQWHLSSAAPPVEPRVPPYRGGVEWVFTPTEDGSPLVFRLTWSAPTSGGPHQADGVQYSVSFWPQLVRGCVKRSGTVWAGWNVGRSVCISAWRTWVNLPKCCH